MNTTNKLTKYTPRNINNGLSLFDRLFETPFDDLFFSFGSAMNWPSSNYNYTLPNWQSNENDYTLSVNLPGIHKEDIELTLEGETLLLNYKTRTTKESKSLSFSTYVPIGCDLNTVKSVYQNGVLTVTFQKTESAKSKKVPIE